MGTTLQAERAIHERAQSQSKSVCFKNQNLCVAGWKVHVGNGIVNDYTKVGAIFKQSFVATLRSVGFDF